MSGEPSNSCWLLEKLPKTRHSNLDCYKKIDDSVPHTWIQECFGLYINRTLSKFIARVMINCSIYQGVLTAVLHRPKLPQPDPLKVWVWIQVLSEDNGDRCRNLNQLQHQEKGTQRNWKILRAERDGYQQSWWSEHWARWPANWESGRSRVHFRKRVRWMSSCEMRETLGFLFQKGR